MALINGWTLDSVRKDIVTVLQPVSRAFGYHLCLGGGVLNNGTSDKDADIYFLPLERESQRKADPDGLQRLLDGMWQAAGEIGDNAYHREKDTRYEKMLRYHTKGRVVDVFMMRGVSGDN